MLKSVSSTNKEDRRRGRPAGKNRVPLSKEERRARNAQYERERRNETAEVMAQLAEAAFCDPHISNAELLATVINRIQRASKRNPTEIDDLRRINDNLENQIAILEKRLGDDADYESELREDQKQEDLQSESSSNSEDRPITRPRKYRKLSKTSTIHKIKRSGKKIRYTTESSSSSTSEWTETDGTYQERETQDESTSIDDTQQRSDAFKQRNEETKEFYRETKVIKQDIIEAPSLNEPSELEQSSVTQAQLEDSFGPLTDDIRGVLSDLLNDNEIIELGIQDANELTNWPVNIEDVFVGY